MYQQQTQSNNAARFAEALGVVWVVFALITGIVLYGMRLSKTNHETAATVSQIPKTIFRTIEGTQSPIDVLKTKVNIKNPDGSSPDESAKILKTQVQVTK